MPRVDNSTSGAACRLPLVVCVNKTPTNCLTLCYWHVYEWIDQFSSELPLLWNSSIRAQIPCADIKYTTSTWLLGSSLLSQQSVHTMIRKSGNLLKWATVPCKAPLCAMRCAEVPLLSGLWCTKLHVCHSTGALLTITIIIAIISIEIKFSPGNYVLSTTAHLSVNRLVKLKQIVLKTEVSFLNTELHSSVWGVHWWQATNIHTHLTDADKLQDILTVSPASRYLNLRHRLTIIHYCHCFCLALWLGFSIRFFCCPSSSHLLLGATWPGVTLRLSLALNTCSLQCVFEIRLSSFPSFRLQHPQQTRRVQTSDWYDSMALRILKVPATCNPLGLPA